MSWQGLNLYRIRATRDIKRYGIKKGDLGGRVCSEDNLSHTGDCWITYNAIALDYSKVLDYSLLHDNAILCDNAIISFNAKVGGYSIIYSNTIIFTFS